MRLTLKISMKVVYKNLPSKRVPCVATIGVFDGIHRGHRFILEKVRAEAGKLNAASLLITFDKPPRVVLKKPFDGCLSDLADKKNITASLGIDYVWFLKARKGLLKLSGKEFIVYILKYFDIKKIIVGDDFRFGTGAQNNVDCLQGFAKEHNFDFLVVKKIRTNGRIVSSSAIRRLVQRADFARAGALLGRRYSLKGRVVKGRGFGRKIGFPTANISTGNYVIPPRGVYAGLADFARKKYLCAVNIGIKPTVTSRRSATVEAYIIDFKKNISGKIITLYFLRKIRAEKKFSSLSKLKTAIAGDVARIQRRFRTEE